MYAPNASSADTIRVRTTAGYAGRFPRRAGITPITVTSPRNANSRLTPSGGATLDPMTPSSAMSMTPRTAMAYWY